MTERIGDGSTVFCTVASRNYVPYVRVLARSLADHHPRTRFRALLADRSDGPLPDSSPAIEWTLQEELAIPMGRAMRFYYDILENDTAVKPWFFRSLFDDQRVDRVIYLDPDILVLRPLEDVLAALARAQIVVTPHILEPYPGPGRPDDLAILRAGTMNLGFLGLSRGAQTDAFLEWWCSKLVEGGFLDLARGLHVDQRWVDLAIGFFEATAVLRDPTLNVAYWNFHERQIEKTEAGFAVRGRPIGFMHFSGLSLDDIDAVSRHQDRWRLSDLGPAARELFERYQREVLREGREMGRHQPYAFGAFDSGVAIPAFVRRMYYALGPERDSFGDPFVTAGRGSFWAWLQRPVPGGDPRLTNVLLGLHGSRESLRERFPDPLGRDRSAYLGWLRRHGTLTFGVDPLMAPALGRAPVAHRALAPVLRAGVSRAKPTLRATLGRSPRLWFGARRIFHRLAPPPDA